MRILLVGKDKLSKQQELEWQPDGQGRIRHMLPDELGPWHYAYTNYMMSAGERTKTMYWCPKCDRGVLLDA